LDTPARPYLRTAALPRRLAHLALAAVALLLLPAVAAAQTSAMRPTIDAVSCRTQCLGIHRVTPGGVVRVSGEEMQGVAQVVLLGRRGARDDVTVAATPVSPTAVEAVVPAGAHGGPVRVVPAGGLRSKAAGRLVVLAPGARDPGGPMVEASVETRHFLFENGRTATVDLFVRGAQPVPVTVDVVRASDRVAVAHFAVSAPPGAVQSLAWDGTSAGVAQPDGRYVFQVAAAAPDATTGAQAAQYATSAPRRASFWIVRDQFPIAGKHTYGQGFGAARSGHVHQGQDVMAACGTPLVAVHSGTVKFVGSQALAGNYIVISADDDSGDQVYMHLRDPALVAKRATVTTGQQIGFVGRTGDATACHLHFELWPAPGWYTGGHPVDPLPSLKSWDTTGA
jgi:Peptidase family M23